MSWLDRDGVEIVHRSDGSLQVGVNQKAESSGAQSPPGQFPLVDRIVANALPLSWRFFAVTYDSTATSAHLKIYVGTRDINASPVACRDYPAGNVGPRIAPGLSIGNVPPASRQINSGCNFRGLVGELRIFESARDGSGALSLASLLIIQGRN